MENFIRPRLYVLCLMAVLSLIAFGLSAGLDSTVSSALKDNFDTAVRDELVSGVGLATAASLITLLLSVFTLLRMRLVKIQQWKAFPDLAWIEISWIAVLWIIWLATAILETQFAIVIETALSFGVTIDPETGFEVLNDVCASRCQAAKALEALTWIIWLIFFGYLVALLTRMTIKIRRGEGKISKLEMEQLGAPRTDTLHDDKPETTQV